jgi:acetylornithine deacetylase/succinyl-diaminopimelate desuccinylase-like protein
VSERLEELYAIGATRIGGSPEENAAHALARGWLEEAGLAVEVDPAGNLIGKRGSGETWIGSHLDTVPNGGRFDGALGVVAGIEVADRTDAPLAVVAFRDEERGCTGSRARVATGPLPRAYLELHIEQGPVLERAGAPLGLVTAITGQARGEVVFEGAAGHAGTTPMDARRDALVEAAQFVLHVRDAARDDAVATVGRLDVEPGAVNVIPARVRVSVDARSPDPDRLEELVREIGFEPTYRTPPVAMSGPPFEALRATLAEPVLELPSGAGHDAGILAVAGVPAAMLFVRSLNGGVSHSPDELSSPEDVELAVQVLIAALDRIGR